MLFSCPVRGSARDRSRFCVWLVSGYTQVFLYYIVSDVDRVERFGVTLRFFDDLSTAS